MSAHASHSLPSLLLCGSPNELTITLVKRFQEDNIKVFIASYEVNTWKKILEKEDIYGVTVAPILDTSSLEKTDYVLYVDFYYGLINSDQAFKRRNEAISWLFRVIDTYTKSLFVVPYVQEISLFESTKTLFDNHPRGVKTLYIGEPVFSEGGFSEHEMWKEILSSLRQRTLSAPLASTTIYPLDIEKITNYVLHSLFSFSKSKEAYIGTDVVVNNLIHTLTKGKESLSIVPSSLVLTKERVEDIQKGSFKHDELLVSLRKWVRDNNVATTNESLEKLETNIHDTVPIQKEKKHQTSTSILTPINVQKKERLNSFVDKKNIEKKKPASIFVPKIEIPSINEKIKRIPKPKKISKRQKQLVWKPLYAKILLSISFILLLPIILSVSSFLTILLGSSVYSKSIYDSYPLYNIGGNISLFAQEIVNPYTYIPGLGKYYKKVWYSMDIVHAYSRIMNDEANLKTLTIGLFESLTTEHSQTTESVLSDILITLDSLDTQIGYVSAEMQSEDDDTPSSLIRNFPQEKLSIDSRERLVTIRRFMSELYEGLGINEAKTYALVLYDTNSRQPLGGKITSTILVTISGGKLIDVSTYTSDFITDQIGGEVAPPVPLKEVFGMENWSYEYAGWYLDSRKSAQQIEWFLNKSLDITIDGVLTVSQTMIDSLIEDVGQISLPSAGQTVNSSSFNTVYEGVLRGDPKYHGVFVQDVWDGILKAAVGATQETRTNLGKTIVNSLTSKEMTLYFRNNAMQDTIEKLSFSGKIDIVGCGSNCISDYLGIYESALDNSGNLQREASFDVSVEQGLIKRKLTYILQNTSSNVSQNYVRILAPSDVGFGSVKVSVDGEVQDILPDRFAADGYKAVGAPLNVPANGKVIMTTEWESGISVLFDKRGDYFLTWYKQSGSEEYPISIQTSLPETLKISALPSGTLTERGFVRYNTNLEHDTNIHVFW